MNKKIIKVNKTEAGQRLDKIITSRLKLSRPYIKNQIKNGTILVNGQTSKPSYFTKENDIISFEKSLTYPEANQKMEILANPEIKFKIIYEDDNVIVIDKPAGISVHPRSNKYGKPLESETKNTLASGLLSYYPQLKEIGEEPKLRPGIVHRLDKDTSGIMIIAKNNDAFQYLKEQFQRKIAEKKYLALVIGKLKEKEGIIRAHITRSESDPTKQMVISEQLAAGNKKAREATTKYKIIKEFKDFSLIEARPLTGRMHQIRLHLAFIGHPVAGDRKYAKKNSPVPDKLKRQFLHAAYLKINLPQIGPKEFKAELPADLVDPLEILSKV